MNAIGTLISAIADSFTPDGTLMRIRFRASLDMIVTLLITLLAIALTIGYQVFGRWSRRSARTD